MFIGTVLSLSICLHLALWWTDDLSRVYPASRPITAGIGSNPTSRPWITLNVHLKMICFRLVLKYTNICYAHIQARNHHWAVGVWDTTVHNFGFEPCTTSFFYGHLTYLQTFDGTFVNSSSWQQIYVYSCRCAGFTQRFVVFDNGVKMNEKF